MSFSISVDWSEEYENYSNLGRQAIEESCTHKTQDKDSDEENRETNMRYSGSCEECDFCEDSAHPMMNFVYPLETQPSEDRIFEVVKRTNCTIMQKNNTDECFLTLCGGGMDLSQDIALAYIICEKWIPMELLQNVQTQKELSVSGYDWKLLEKEMAEQLKTRGNQLLEEAKRWRKRDTK
jgi:hypothetical protein